MSGDGVMRVLQPADFLVTCELKAAVTPRSIDTKPFKDALSLATDSKAQSAVKLTILALLARIRAETDTFGKNAALDGPMEPPLTDSVRVLVMYVKVLVDVLTSSLAQRRLPATQHMHTFGAVAAMLHHFHDPSLAKKLLVSLIPLLRLLVSVCDAPDVAERCDVILAQERSLLTEQVRGLLRCAPHFLFYDTHLHPAQVSEEPFDVKEHADLGCSSSPTATVAHLALLTASLVARLHCVRITGAAITDDERLSARWSQLSLFQGAPLDLTPATVTDHTHDDGGVDERKSDAVNDDAAAALLPVVMRYVKFDAGKPFVTAAGVAVATKIHPTAGQPLVVSVFAVCWLGVLRHVVIASLSALGFAGAVCDGLPAPQRPLG